MVLPRSFLMVCCHQGAEGALKAEMSAQGWNLAFSRPGFVSFKPASGELISPAAPVPRGVFARTASWSLGKIQAAHTAPLADEILRLLADHGATEPFVGLHLWERDRLPAGERGYEPGLEVLTHEIASDVHGRLRASGRIASDAPNRTIQPGELALDVIRTDADRWMVGWHQADGFPPSRWPGGFPPLDFQAERVSRAYYKAAEAILWSRLPIRDGDTAVEIGSAPGGAAQRLLELGLKVIGVDPAEMDPRVAENPSFTHLRARGGDVKRSEYSDARWLLVDSNVRPDKTLVTVANIVSHRSVGIEGMLLTMKIGRYDQSDRIPGWCRTIRQWGFNHIDVRQLATGRCEVCIAARRTSDS